MKTPYNKIPIEEASYFSDNLPVFSQSAIAFDQLIPKEGSV